MTKECPLCGELMRDVVATIVHRIPGTAQSVVREIPEWRCPECDYFEERDDEDDAAQK